MIYQADRRSEQRPISRLMFTILATGAIVGTFSMLRGWSTEAEFREARATCGAKADAMAVTWSYGERQGCMITVDGRTIPLDAYRVVKTQ